MTGLHLGSNWPWYWPCPTLVQTKTKIIQFKLSHGQIPCISPIVSFTLHCNISGSVNTYGWMAWPGADLTDYTNLTSSAGLVLWYISLILHAMLVWNKAIMETMCLVDPNAMLAYMVWWFLVLQLQLFLTQTGIIWASCTVIMLKWHRTFFLVLLCPVYLFWKKNVCGPMVR